MTLYGSVADLPHSWCFLEKRSLSVLCMTKLARKNRSCPLHTLVLRLMPPWGMEEKEPGWGQSSSRVDYAAWLRAARSDAWHVFAWPDDTSESCFQLVVLPSLVTSSGGLLYLKRVAVRCQTLHFWELECLNSCSSTSTFVDVFVGSNRLARKASHCTSLVLLLSDTHLLAVEGGKYYSITILALPESVGVFTNGSDMAYLISSTLRNMLGRLSFCTSMQCWASWSEWMEVWHPISCWRSCESRGMELCAR